MSRHFLRVVLALLPLATLVSGGCSLIVDGRIEVPVTDCAGEANGTRCQGGDYCFAETCRYAFCGDGIVNQSHGEECDDGNLLAGDGCQPVTCAHTCDGDTPCSDDGNVCNGPESCSVAEHVCSSGPNTSGVSCSVGAETGACSGGFCVPPGCGDLAVVPPEECDPPGGGCQPNCTYECELDFECPVADPCVADRKCDVASHLCMDLPGLNCDDGDACTSDGCSAGVGGCFNHPMDADADGYAPMMTCGVGSALFPNDCNDSVDTVHPMAPEQLNGVDDDCNGLVDDNVSTVTCYLDFDDDGYPDASISTTGSECPAGYRPARGDSLFDCNDRRKDVHPGSDPGAFSATPYCKDERDPYPADRSWGCDDGSAPSFDWDCNGAEEPLYPLSQADACNSEMCDGGGWADGVAACGTSATFVDCYFQTSCLISIIPGTRTQTCR